MLAAGGVSVCWLLVMTLLLPPLDNARSYRAMMQRVARVVPASACIAAPGMTRAEVVALEYLGGYRVDAMTPAGATTCDYLLLERAAKAAAGAGWQLVASAWRNRPDDDLTDIYRRTRASMSSRPRGASRADSSVAAAWPALAAPLDAGRRLDAANAHRRKDEPEARALVGLAGDVELAAVTLHHVLDDRQAEAGAARFARAAAVDAIEALGQAREMGSGDAAPAVDDGDLAAAVVGHAASRRRSCRRRACSGPRC